MRRKVLWIGIGLAVTAYLAWTATHSTSVPTSGLPSLPTAAVTATPGPTAAAGASPTPAVAPRTPTPTPAVAPTLLLNAGQVTRGSVVVASGMGFQGGEKLRLTLHPASGPSVTLVNLKADAHGEFSGIVVRVANTWPNGTQRIEVAGLSSHRTANARFGLVGSPPGAAPTTYAGKPLSQVSFNGGGFTAREDVDVYFDTLASPVLATFTANQIGVVHVTGVAVPMSAPGQHAFLLVGRSSRAPVRVPFSVLAFTPWLGLSSYTPQPEQSISVVGHDFAPGERVAVFLDSDRGRPLAQATVDRTGVFHADSAFEVPYDQRGKTRVVAIGALSQTEVTATLTVLPDTPLISLSRYAGPPGTAFTVQGKGFARSENVRVQLGGGQQPLVFDFGTDSTGRLTDSRPIQLPRDLAAGKLSVTAVGNHSQVPVSVTFAVTPLSPWFGPAPAAGPAGSRVSFNGGGFAPDETVQIAIKSDPAIVLGTTLTTDRNGEIHRQGSLLIPTAMSGPVSLEATGVQSGARAAAVFTVIGGERRNQP
ncbi:MAG: hypothetical protein ACRDIY_19420 [Chloroflexota bacterium]